MMGHADIQTTMIYLDWANDDERDRNIANSVFGGDGDSAGFEPRLNTV